MGLFDSIFGGSKTKNDPASVWGQQAPFLRGLYERSYGASLGMGAGGVYPGAQQGGQMAGGRQYGNPVSGGWRTAGMNRGQGRANIQPAPGQPGARMGNDPLQGLGGQLTQAGQGFLGNLGQGVMGQGPYMGALAQYAQAGNPFAQGQIGQLGNALGRQFNQYVLPGITSTFANSGTLGGDRQALALGQAGEGLANAFASGATDILGNSAALGVQAAGLGAANQLGFGQAGLQGLGDVFGAGNMAVFGSLPGLSSLLGGPAVLGGGGSTRQSNGIAETAGTLGALAFLACHVARLVFGPDNAEWVQFYAWKESRPRFRRVYDRVAAPLAGWLADKPRLQAVVRRWMRSRIRGAQS